MAEIFNKHVISNMATIRYKQNGGFIDVLFFTDFYKILGSTRQSCSRCRSSTLVSSGQCAPLCRHHKDCSGPEKGNSSFSLLEVVPMILK